MPRTKVQQELPAAGPVPVGAPIVLIAGFGVLLILMATAGFDSLRILGQVQETNRQINSNYLERERTLEKIRGKLYESGTLVRDYILLDPGITAANELRTDLKSKHDEMNQTLVAYAQSLRSDEKADFDELKAGIDTYWAVLQPIFKWDAEDKRERGYWFLRQEVFPRRNSVLNIAAKIAAVNNQSLRDGEKQVSDVFARFGRRLRLMTGAALGIGVVVAFLAVGYILRLEKKVHQRYRESLHAQAELKQLSGRLLDVQEQERRSISRELHDEVGQSLTALLMDLGNLAATVPTADRAFRQRLDGIRALAENSLNVVRNMSLLLRPSMLDDLGLFEALEWQAREVSRRTGMLVEVLPENVSDDLPEAHKTCVYRVVQAALQNCLRHAQARSVQIAVRQESDRLLLRIQDDGVGFDSHNVRGMGLIGMTERVSHLGGTFRVDSEPNQGTLLSVELPLTSPLAETSTVAS